MDFKCRGPGGGRGRVPTETNKFIQMCDVKIARWKKERIMIPKGDPRKLKLRNQIQAQK